MASAVDDDRRVTFPVPFAGVEYRVPAKGQRELDEFVLRLLACNHQHHFAVSGDAIWVSANALDWGCLEGGREPQMSRDLAKMMGEATAYDVVSHTEVPCNVVWNEPCRRVEVEFTAPCSIEQGVHWVDDDDNVVFTWFVQRSMGHGDIASFKVEFEDGRLL